MLRLIVIAVFVCVSLIVAHQWGADLREPAVLGVAVIVGAFVGVFVSSDKRDKSKAGTR